MWKHIKRWWAAEGALVELQGVTDRMLEDMGLDRETLRARVLAQHDPVSDRRECRHHASGKAALTR